MTDEDAFRRYRGVLESLGADTLHTLDDVLAKDVRFKDPIHDVTGRDTMKDVFSRLFGSTDDLVFIIDDWACSKQSVYFRWTLTARLSGKPWSVTGVTQAAFDAAGQVTDHVEYWDAASQLYDRFPVIGPLLRFVRRRIAAS